MGHGRLAFASWPAWSDVQSATTILFELSLVLKSAAEVIWIGWAIVLKMMVVKKMSYSVRSKEPQMWCKVFLKSGLGNIKMSM